MKKVPGRRIIGTVASRPLEYRSRWDGSTAPVSKLICCLLPSSVREELKSVWMLRQWQGEKVGDKKVWIFNMSRRHQCHGCSCWWSFPLSFSPLVSHIWEHEKTTLRGGKKNNIFFLHRQVQKNLLVRAFFGALHSLFDPNCSSQTWWSPTPGTNVWADAASQAENITVGYVWG